MGATAALKLRQVSENLAQILSIELFCAAQGVDFRRDAIGRDKRLGDGTKAIYERIRTDIPFVQKDEYMKNHMNSALTIVREFVFGRGNE